MAASYCHRGQCTLCRETSTDLRMTGSSRFDLFSSVYNSNDSPSMPVQKSSDMQTPPPLVTLLPKLLLALSQSSILLWAMIEHLNPRIKKVPRYSPGCSLLLRGIRLRIYFVFCFLCGGQTAVERGSISLALSDGGVEVGDWLHAFNHKVSL